VAKEMRVKPMIPCLTALALAVPLAGCEVAATAGQAAPKAARQGDTDMQQATFAAGCFWGVEAAFRRTPGVTATTVGYTGGKTADPTYKEVCSDKTGHAEAVHVEFDPTVVSYEELLDAFWTSHDPTQVNRQGPDVGSQYRSAIFYHTPEQQAAAEASRERLAASGKHATPVATEVVPAAEFYRAEDYHQQYLEKRGLAACHVSLE